MWVGAFSGPLFKADPNTGRLIKRIPLHAVDHIAIGGGLVWARVSDVSLLGLDPATGKVKKRYKLPIAEIPGGGIAWIKGELWVTNWTDDSVWRIPHPAA